MCSTNISMIESVSAATSLASTDRRKIKKKNENILFTPAQDQLKTMSNFFNIATSKLTADFNSESQTVFSKHRTCTDSHEIKRLKKVKNDERVALFCKRVRKYGKDRV